VCVAGENFSILQLNSSKKKLGPPISRNRLKWFNFLSSDFPCCLRQLKTQKTHTQKSNDDQRSARASAAKVIASPSSHDHHTPCTTSHSRTSYRIGFPAEKMYFATKLTGISSIRNNVENDVEPSLIVNGAKKNFDDRRPKYAASFCSQ